MVNEVVKKILLDMEFEIEVTPSEKIKTFYVEEDGEDFIKVMFTIGDNDYSFLDVMHSMMFDVDFETMSIYEAKMILSQVGNWWYKKSCMESCIED